MSHPIEYNGRQLTAWKSSLHGHTTVSDGWQTPQEIIDRYVQGKYDVVNFSDHRKTNPVSSYDGKGLTLISGIELHPMGPRNILWHLLAVNVPEDFPGIYETAEDAVKAVNAVGGIVYIAHPYWCGLDVEELKPIAGMDGVLIYERRRTWDNTVRKLLLASFHLPRFALAATRGKAARQIASRRFLNKIVFRQVGRKGYAAFF